MHDSFDALKSDFESIQDSISLIVEGGGSKTGLTAIQSGHAQIGLSSFPFNLDSLFGPDHGILAKVVAYDGIVIINNRLNPIRQLTNQQISGIFSGSITNWAELGGNPGQIIPVIRDQNSGTQKFFTEYFGVERVSDASVVAGENSEIVAKVNGIKSGIGFIGFSYFAESINDIELKSVNEDRFIPPTFRHVKDGSYPLKRSLQVYFKEDYNPAVSAFLSYLETPRAKSVMEMHGLIPIYKMQ